MSPEPPEQEEEETTTAEGWNSCDSNHLLLAYYMYMYVHMYLLATQYNHNDNLNINFIEIQRSKNYFRSVTLSDFLIQCIIATVY